jgi:hypothetical protein
MFGGNADTGIGDGQYRRFVVASCRDSNRAAWTVVVDGIAQQVRDDLLETLGRRKRGRRLERRGDCDASTAGCIVESCGGDRDNRREIHRLALRRQVALVDACEREEGFRELPHLLRRFETAGDGLAILARAALPRQGGLRLRDDDCQRGAQFVCRIGGELQLSCEGRFQA